jgi:hypothetical protein
MPEDLPLAEWCAAELERLLDAEQLAMLAAARARKRLAAEAPERHPEARTCAWCAVWFVPADPRGDAARFCDLPCRKAAQRKRAAGREALAA